MAALAPVTAVQALLPESPHARITSCGRSRGRQRNHAPGFPLAPLDPGPRGLLGFPPDLSADLTREAEATQGRKCLPLLR
jgi:hypothetical protein